MLIIIIMNKRILKSANSNKKQLQILRQNRQIISTDILHQTNANQIAQSVSSLGNNSKGRDKSKQNSISVHPKKFSINESKQFSSSDQSQLYSSLKKSTSKNGRPSSYFKNIYSIKNRSIQQTVTCFIDLLRSKAVLHPHFNNYIVEISKFGKIINYILTVYNHSQSQENFYQKLVKEEHRFTEFMRKSEYNKSISEEKFKFKKLLSFSSCVFSQTISNQCAISLQNQIKILEEQVKAHKIEINDLRHRRDQINSDLSRKNSQYTLIKYQIEKLQYDFDQYIKREDYIRDAIHSKEQILAEVDKRKKEIACVFQEREMANLKQTFEEFKHLEQRLFLFANYLKCHPLGERNYEQSKRKIYIERLLQKQSLELRRVLKSSNYDPDKKQEYVTIFLNKYHQEYHSIIEQLQEVIKDKTDFINEYTQLIAQWSQNCGKKKKVLENLRDSYCLETIINERNKPHDHSTHKTINNLVKLYQICQSLL